MMVAQTVLGEVRSRLMPSGLGGFTVALNRRPDPVGDA